MENEFLNIEEEIVKQLRTVFDPEIPVNIYDLGLIYSIDVKDDNSVEIEMTLTAPACPAADFIMDEVNDKVNAVGGIKGVTVNLVFDPPWDKDMMSEEARLELGFL
ncbi:SUF system Fe-S cluster assembly protein [Saccharicrinis sp. FJH54]|uniref:SUF system Fe-S cluster assembly protein n=1 Tax=Saccharicrinis sp. FJH54 TaxID=3344665 RepID=UPI0035D43917